MAHYAIGDIQGCFDEFQSLLAKLAFNPGADTLWLTGDLVNRGPKSLETLEFVHRHAGSMQTILGNHDLHLLAIAHGHAQPQNGDTIIDILNSPLKKKLLSWLLEQPLVLSQNNTMMVHAGLWSTWTQQQAENLAHEASQAIQKQPADFFAHMYHNTPDRWHDELTATQRIRCIVNIMTRLRTLHLDGSIDFSYKSGLSDMPSHLKPWFKEKNRQTQHNLVIFGHWSSLGLYQQDSVIGLDTGALWGKTLTAIDLDTKEIIQVPSQNKLTWEKFS